MAPGGARARPRRRVLTAPSASTSCTRSATSTCCCRWRSATTSTSTRRSTTPRTSGGSCARPEPLLPNWRHLPVGYHGRARHGGGQRHPHRRGRPASSPTPSTAGRTSRRPVPSTSSSRSASSSAARRRRDRAVDHADSHVFGAVLLNDWSARDIQAFEYQPLGPHLAKSFATTISPWVVTMDVLRPSWSGRPSRTPAPAPTCAPAALPCGLDLDLEVLLELGGDAPGPPAVAITALLAACTGRSPSSSPTSPSTAPAPGAGDLFGSGTVERPDAARARGA